MQMSIMAVVTEETPCPSDLDEKAIFAFTEMHASL